MTGPSTASKTRHRSTRVRAIIATLAMVVVAICFSTMTASAAPRISKVVPDPAIPNCGGSIELLNLGYSGGVFAFKLQALSGALRPWLGSGSGTMDWQAGVLGGSVQKSGTVGASTTQGTSIPRTTINVPAGKEANVEAEIFQGNFEACATDFIVTF